MIMLWVISIVPISFLVSSINLLLIKIIQCITIETKSDFTCSEKDTVTADI